MKLYLIAGEYVGTQADARDLGKRVGIKIDADSHEAEVPTDKAGLLSYLNGLFADRGNWREEYETVVERCDPPTPYMTTPPAQLPGVNLTDLSVGLDDDFQRLPLAHQLHLATLALENARQEIKPPVVDPLRAPIEFDPDTIAAHNAILDDLEWKETPTDPILGELHDAGLAALDEVDPLS